MAKLKIFISSTCYDLDVLRSELRPFIIGLGYEPIMSDYSDILYDPRKHTHDSCIKEVPNSDMLIVIIGSRFGGTAVPSAYEDIDFDLLIKESSNPEVLKEKDKFSITQLEVFKAIESGIPVYTFVDQRVIHDHHVYEKNKNKPSIISEIDFPSIQKKDSAKYIFEFINFLTHRNRNNGLSSFNKLDDIKLHLVQQWASLFQKLLSEERKRDDEARKYKDFSKSLEDLKVAILASISTPDARDIAKAAIKYRRLVSFISSFRHVMNNKDILLSKQSWGNLLLSLKIKEIKPLSSEERYRFGRNIVLILEDDSFYIFKYPVRVLDEIKEDWSSFIQLEDKIQQAVVDGLLEDVNNPRDRMLYYMKGIPFKEYYEEGQEIKMVEKARILRSDDHIQILKQGELRNMDDSEQEE